MRSGTKHLRIASAIQILLGLGHLAFTYFLAGEWDGTGADAETALGILALSYGVVAILRTQQVSDRYHFLVDALEFIDQYRKLNDEDLLAIVGGSFGPDGGASSVEIANVRSIRRRNAEITAHDNGEENR